MAIFPGAHDFVVSNSQFNVHNNGPSGIDILFEASAPDAAVDAEARRYAPSCFPGTREQYIADITNWATTSNDGQVPPIYWMKGPAGVGKSAIAQTCAKRVKGSGHLGAAFFFSINGRNDHRHFFTTLAYQLSTVLPDYRQVLDSAIQRDRTLVTKVISSQFDGLIVDPLRELTKKGKEIRRRVIFIDGLDECSSTDAQSEIIEIIAASVRDKTTPFRWAIFSRAEAHIVSTFSRSNISPYSHTILLPVSRDSDREIEIYLRGGFENILRRRNLPLSTPWPSDEAIRGMVNASAGLFVYPATVLRFIDNDSYSGFMERLEAVLDAIFQYKLWQPHKPFAELDVFYVLIMKRIPKGILPSVQLLLANLIDFGEFDTSSRIALICNSLGLSETDFRSVSNALQSVLVVQEPPEPPTFDQGIDLARSYHDQDCPVDTSSALLYNQAACVHGTIAFLHKSFYEFLIDPTRSSTFCVTAPAIRAQLFDRYVQRHLLYVRSYDIQGDMLVSAPDKSNSSVSLSWPQGSEFVDSLLKISSFSVVSACLSNIYHSLGQFISEVPESALLKLAEFDYRKHLICVGCITCHDLAFSVWVIGFKIVDVRSIAGTQYGRVKPGKFGTLNLVAFLEMVKKLEELKIIKRCHRHLSSIFASVYRAISPLKPSGKRHGQYKVGRGEKSVIWYWEFDTKERYFHDFRTVNFVEAKNIYDTEKLRMWEDDWKMPS